MSSDSLDNVNYKIYSIFNAYVAQLAGAVEYTDCFSAVE